MFGKRKIAKRLQSIGSRIDETYLIYVNNDEPKCFASYDECLTYLSHYRDTNVIFKLQIFRTETYTL